MRVYLNGKEVARYPQFGPGDIESLFTAIAPAAPALRDAFVLGAKITAMAIGSGIPICSWKIGQHRVVALGEDLAACVPEGEIEKIIGTAEALTIQMEAGHDPR